MKVDANGAKIRRPMSEADIRALKPREKRYMVCDGDRLYLEVRPNGTMSWVFRDQQGGVVIKKVLGKYPEMSLYAARKERDRAKVECKRERTEVIRRRTEPTFEALSEEWMLKQCRAKTSPQNQRRQQSRLDRYINPVIGLMYPADLTPQDVLAIARNIENAGHIDLAHDVTQLVGMILRYGVACGSAPRDVTADLRGALMPVRRIHHPSLQRREDVGELMRLLDGLIEGPLKWLLLFNIYTFVRPGEARRAVWPEFDLDRAEWRIPAERMKMRRPHIVPLSRQAMELLRRAEHVRASEYCFPSTWNSSRPFSDSALMIALLKLGYTRDRISIHGFRSMASTTLNEHGFNADAIERQLAHVEGSSVRAAYNYAERLPERRDMMQWYADWLDALRDGTPEPPVPR